MAACPGAGAGVAPDAAVARRSIWKRRRRIGSEWQRAEALGALASQLLRLPLATLDPLWKETLPLAATRTREDLLADLFALVPIIATLGGAEALSEIGRAIQDVGRWWP